MNNWIVDLNQKEQARGTALVFVPHAGGGPNAFRSVAREIRRSEERRVGKECRL